MRERALANPGRRPFDRQPWPHRVYFVDTVVVITSNAGSADALRDFFRPEFLNRIDEIVEFRPLEREELADIVELQLQRLRERLAERGLSLELTDAAKEVVLEAGWDPTYGARPLKRALQRLVENPLAKALLEAQLRRGRHRPRGRRRTARSCSRRPARPSQREPHPVLHGDLARRLHRRPGQLARLALHAPARSRRAAELRRVHRGRRRAGDGVDDVRVDPRPRVRRQGAGGVEVAVRRFRAGSSRTGSCRSSPARRSSSRARTSQRCTEEMVSGRGRDGTSGSSAEATWRVSSQTLACSTRSS